MEYYRFGIWTLAKAIDSQQNFNALHRTDLLGFSEQTLSRALPYHVESWQPGAQSATCIIWKLAITNCTRMLVQQGQRPYFHGWYHPSMVKLGMVFYCLTNIACSLYHALWCHREGVASQLACVSSPMFHACRFLPISERVRRLCAENSRNCPEKGKTVCQRLFGSTEWIPKKIQGLKTW